MKCLFLYNPQSGKGKINKYVKFAEKELKEKFEAVDVACSEGPKDMEKKAKEACGKYDYLVFSGGDGSFNEVTTASAVKIKSPFWDISRRGRSTIFPVRAGFRAASGAR